MHQLGLPKAEELRQLTDAFQLDPVGTFVPLAQAYLALGRPREAIDVAARGVQAAPDNMQGRLLLGRAYYQLHQWKQAQSQLLRVVKSDRNHAEAFFLLGEVLLRRGDYERALPVLQHAHNLDPANPAVLAMVKRARSQQPLDEPNPIPTPLQPEGASGPPLPDPFDDDAETNLAPKPILQAALAGASSLAATAPAPVPAWSGAAEPPPMNPGRAAVPSPPVAPPLAAPTPPAAPPRPPPGGSAAFDGDGGRPRVFAPDKRKDAAQESLRRSAQVGEDYLNQLLTGGLLDLPNVRVAPADYEIQAGQHWGRSTKRTFIVLFVMLFLGAGSAGGWYYYAEKKKRETIAQHLAKAKAQAVTGSHADLDKAMDESRAALELEKSNTHSISVISYVMGLEAYLYRDVQPEEVDLGIETAEAKREEGDEGARELVLARAASTLASLAKVESAEGRLADVRKALREYLSENPDDHLARWLSGRAMLAAGDRRGAAAAFDQAAARGQGTVLAMIDRADMLLDEGQHDQAMQIYNDVLKRSPDHPLACIGRSLARSERSVESAEALADLNVCLGDDMGPRVSAYKQLAFAFAYHFIEDYDDFVKSLNTATDVSEPRFLARVALARLLQGKITDAGQVRANIRWYASDPQPHPLVQLVDAELFYATGLNEEVMKLVGKASGLRAHKLRGRVYWDEAKYTEAADEFDAALKIAPEDLEALVYAAAIRVATSKGAERRAAEDAIDKLGRRAKSKLPRHVYGEALIRDGRSEQARDEFEKALSEVSETAPHPMAYRSHIALARLDVIRARKLQEKEPAQADESRRSALRHLNDALKQNPSNLRALDLAGRLLVASDRDRALQFLIPVVDAGQASGGAELAYAELLANSKNEIDRKKAREAVIRAKDKNVSAEELARVAMLVGGESFAVEVTGAAPR